ncbi:hypothetical protein [Klebsiella pneumoniae]|uniref:hypothetical protein n=1 Tax=Klebsiella pneumoniae TaxID=573 RepID=UPI00132BBA79|nr:hypothetical protein [Klebsiella pneumoniae]MCT8061502.1 hypothetical protein [Klebsiella pneumoniae]MVW69075.1 hypothetical protein [Klebsiella pneumoniae]
MGFPSPASDYVEQRLSVNSICNVGPNTLLFETSGGYAVVDVSLKPKQGCQVMVCYEGHNQIAKIMGKSLITENGEAIEGEALDDVTVAGVVTHVICDVRSDSLAV